jgi:thiol-disulfide isomerase/thioredoxin
MIPNNPFSVPQVSKPAGRNAVPPTWKSATQQVWKPALRNFGWHALNRYAVWLLLAGLCAGGGLLPVARAQQPSVITNYFDATGHVAGNKEKTVQVKATGRVLDAETGQPLPSFRLTKGALDRDRRSFDWDDKSRQLLTGGAFSVDLTKERLPPAVLIEAEGYLPQCSGPIRALETNLTFQLKKGGGPAGVVLTPEGVPAAGRTVYFSRLNDLVLLEGTNLTPKAVFSPTRSTNTDQAGRFSFEADLDAFSVLVADEAGFAEVRVEDLRASPQVRLQPWARLEGTLKIGSQPGANQTIRLADAFAEYAYYPRPMPPWSISAAATTDAQGRFVFPRVPPVDVKVFHAPKAGAGGKEQLPITQITNLTLNPGETRAVTLGGQGRPVVGRIVLKNYHKNMDWQHQMCRIDSLSPEPADCPNFEAISKEYRLARRAAKSQEDIDRAEARYLDAHERIARQLCAYYSSPAGRQYWFSRRSYSLLFAQDGSFRIDDVPGGTYQLTLPLRDLASGLGQHKSPIIELQRQQIEVPGSPGGRSDTPLDLGVINLVAPLMRGEMAPDLTVKTMDDKTVKLSDYRGKFVLLDFWATWNAPSLAVMPDLKETYESFKNDPHFVLLGLNMDTNLDTARAYSVSHQMGWTQGFLGAWSESAVPEQFGVASLPCAVLIDSAGRVFDPRVREGTFKSAVNAALNP